MSHVSEEEMNEAMIKTIKIEGSLRWFDHVRGYGFIVPNNGGDDVLLHNEVLRDFGQNTKLKPGAVLSCEIMKSPKGLMATKILKVLNNVGFLADTLIQDYPNHNQSEFVPVPVDATKLRVAIVKWYDERKGYGFSITHEEDQDVMLSRQILRRCGIRSLYPGDKIRVLLDHTARGLIANYIEYV